MSKHGPIVIIDDDTDDKEMFESIVRDLGVENPIKWFPETHSAFQYLCESTEPVFLIFCDINLPGRNGIEFKRDIDADPILRKKSIPFIFMSTQANQRDVNQAYTEMTVQGFFKKASRYGESKEMLRNIFYYWSTCQHPNLQ